MCFVDVLFLLRKSVLLEEGLCFYVAVLDLSPNLSDV